MARAVPVENSGSRFSDGTNKPPGRADCGNVPMAWAEFTQAKNSTDGTAVVLSASLGGGKRKALVRRQCFSPTLVNA